MSVLIDGIIFGKQKCGGISRIWNEYLNRLKDLDVPIKLLYPNGTRNKYFDISNVNNNSFRLIKDHFYKPSIVFDEPILRSWIIRLSRINKNCSIFHSTYYSALFEKNIHNIVSVYDMIPELFGNLANRYNREFIRRRKIVFEHAEKIIAISKSTKSDFLKIYPNIKEEKVLVIPVAPFLSSKNTQSNIEDISIHYQLNLVPRTYFLYIGNRTGYKNFKILIDLVKNYPIYKEYKILCIGGERDKLIQYWTQDENIIRIFKFINFVPDDELTVLYNNAIALIYPSLYEGFGLPILEAMTHECPVICSNTSSLPEVGGDAALYFDPESVESLNHCMQIILFQNAKDMVLKGKKNVGRFSWDESTTKLVEVYRSMMN